MDVFSDDEPDLMGLEVVRKFDNLARKLCSVFDEDLNEWAKTSEIYVGIRSEVMREEVYIVQDTSQPVASPNKNENVRKFQKMVETVPLSDKIESRIERVEDPSEDVIVTDKKLKMVFQLPINNKKENIKVVVNDDFSITISHLSNEGKRCTRTLEIQYNTDMETAKATYKNGILEVTFDRIGTQ